ncbi:phage portal protein [Nocardia sp. NPDC020380]|uniref:phage portal protein n=1 Tax=Nocardia sp. NPDC020380 TaxID=3364309 RepID=UPI003789A326
MAKKNYGKLTPEQEGSLRALFQKLDKHETGNSEKHAYYTGEVKVPSLGIAMPEHFDKRIGTVIGWPGTQIDVLEERLGFRGWTVAQSADMEDGEDFGLAEIFRANGLATISAQAHIDALIYGTAFVCVGVGDASIDEPNPSIVVQSPRNMTGLIDPRTRRLTIAASRFWDTEVSAYTMATLYTDTETIVIQRATENMPWRVTWRGVHNLGRVPVVRLVNRAYASQLEGRSEITRGIRSVTNAAVRTMSNAAINQEFYATPQRYMINVSEDQFSKKDGSKVAGFEAVMGRMLGIPFDEDNPEARPSVGQFPQASPDPYLAQLTKQAELFSAEAGIPTTYLAISANQPPSADAIRAMESRLVKRAEKRQTDFGQGWMEVARLALLVRDGKLPEGFNRNVFVSWSDPSTPTKAAAADAATKLRQVEILPKNSRVTREWVGMTEAQIRQLEQEDRNARVDELINGLRGGAAEAREDSAIAERADRDRPVNGDDSKEAA